MAEATAAWVVVVQPRLGARRQAPPCAAAAASDDPVPPRIEGNKKVVIVGGTGRIGRSTAIALAGCEDAGQLDLICAARASSAAAQTALPFVRCDIDDPASVRAAIRGADLVIHTAGTALHLSAAPAAAVLQPSSAADAPDTALCRSIPAASGPPCTGRSYSRGSALPGREPVMLLLPLAAAATRVMPAGVARPLGAFPPTQVCDDTAWAQGAKSRHSQALASQARFTC